MGGGRRGEDFTDEVTSASGGRGAASEEAASLDKVAEQTVRLVGERRVRGPGGEMDTAVAGFGGPAGPKRRGRPHWAFSHFVFAKLFFFAKLKRARRSQ